MPNNNRKDANDLLKSGTDPLSVPADPWPAEEGPDRTERGGREPPDGYDGEEEGPVLPWQGGDPDWWFDDAPDREWLVYAGTGENAPGYLPRGEVGILAGKGAAGKTWALVALSIAVATGRPWLGYRTRPTSGRVAFLAAEEDGTELRRRFQAQAAMVAALEGRDRAEVLRDLAGRVLVLDRKGADIHQEGPALVQGEPLRPSAFGRELLADLRRRAEEGGPWDLVVLDPLSAFGAVDTEKDAAAATATMREIEKLCSLPGGPLVLVAHHTKKPGNKADAIDSDDIRGSSGIVNRARWAGILEGIPVPEGAEAKASGRRFLRLSIVKGNYSPAGPPLVYVQPPLLPTWKDGRQQPARGAIRAIDPDELQIIRDPGKPKGKQTDGSKAATTGNNRQQGKGGIDASNL